MGSRYDDRNYWPWTEPPEEPPHPQGMPTPPKILEGRKADGGVTNIRNVASSHWRRWLSVESRCLVPFTSFAEPDNGTSGGRAPVWFAADASRPLACFADLWTRWKSVRKVKEGEVEVDIFGVLTINPNIEVGAIHPKAMPVILQSPEVRHMDVRAVARSREAATSATGSRATECGTWGAVGCRRLDS